MTALIVDDEPMPAKYLRDLIEKHCIEISQTEIIHSPLEALQHLEHHHYDLLFLDIEMPEMDGFDLVKAADLQVTTQVIFTTAYSQYALEAFEANATHYLVKMITARDLVKAVQKASRVISKELQLQHAPGREENGVLSIFHGDEHHIIRQTHVLRLEAERSYTRLVLKDKEKPILASKSIGYYESKLSGRFFFRCHHSHIINLNQVVRLGKGKSSYVILSNGDFVPVSGSKRESLNRFLGIKD